MTLPADPMPAKAQERVFTLLRLRLSIVGTRRIAIAMTEPQKKSSAPREKPFVPIADRPLLGVPEAAALCGLDEKVVRNAIRDGELIACYAGSSTRRVRRRDLDDWISSLPEQPQ